MQSLQLWSGSISSHTIDAQQCTEIPAMPCELTVIMHLQPAPYDVLQVDEVLPEANLNTALAASRMWTADHLYPLLPWSAIVLTSVPEGS